MFIHRSNKLISDGSAMYGSGVYAVWHKCGTAYPDGKEIIVDVDLSIRPSRTGKS